MSDFERPGVESNAPVLEARGIVKRYGHVEALRGANFSVSAGEVVALVGDNGAGKSTLIKVLSGVIQPDEGQVLFGGQPVSIPSPIAARRLGIETVYQDLALADDLDPTTNVFMGRELLRNGVLGRLGFLDRPEMRRRTQAAFERLSIGVSVATPEVAGLSGGQRQSVAITRAVTWASKVVILDEPTAALASMQTAKVLELIRRIAADGLAVVLISHDLPELKRVADRVEVFRLGKRVARLGREQATSDALLAAMTGLVAHEGV
jgi:simple sugar transport system ATP-binding protein